MLKLSPPRNDGGRTVFVPIELLQLRCERALNLIIIDLEKSQYVHKRFWVPREMIAVITGLHIIIPARDHALRSLKCM